LIGLPVNTNAFAPTPDATTGTIVVFDEAFHFTSVMKNGGTAEAAASSARYVTLNTAGATILAELSTAKSTKETEPLTT
jgi:hypothetical protein